jgi:DNA-binding transcriptional regulator YdaS (Cro superfamily)
MTLSEYLAKKKISQLDFAGRCGVTQSAVSQWLRDGVPRDRVVLVVSVTEGEVTAHDVAPDMYPRGFVFPTEMLQQAAV